MTDFRVLCADLLAWAEKTSAHYIVQPDVLTRARAALAAEPVGEGPTDEELLKLARAELNNSPNWEEPEYDASNPFPYEAPGVAWLNFARAVLARFGHQPAPPVEGEVGELIQWLRSRAGIPASPDFPAVAARLTRAADLLEQRHPAPVPVEGELPAAWLCLGEPDLDTAKAAWDALQQAHALPLPQGEVES